MRSAVTISLVPEARGGPFVYWDDLAAGCREAAARGFDAVEVFPPGADAVDPKELRALLDDHGLALAAVGTGAGWVRHKLSLTSPDAAVRDKAVAFVRSIMDLAARFEAPAIIGSVQGRWGDGASRPEALRYLGGALYRLNQHAADLGTPAQRHDPEAPNEQSGHDVTSRPHNVPLRVALKAASSCEHVGSDARKEKKPTG